MKNIEEMILTLIPKGRANAIHLGELCNRLKVSEHTIKCGVRALRKKGNPIVSDIEGYWITEDKQEIADFIIRMSKQATSRFSSIKALKSQCNETEGQLSIDDLEVSEGVADNEQKEK